MSHTNLQRCAPCCAPWLPDARTSSVNALHVKCISVVIIVIILQNEHMHVSTQQRAPSVPSYINIPPSQHCWQVRCINQGVILETILWKRAYLNHTFRIRSERALAQARPEHPWPRRRAVREPWDLTGKDSCRGGSAAISLIFASSSVLHIHETCIDTAAPVACGSPPRAPLRV